MRKDYADSWILFETLPWPMKGTDRRSLHYAYAPVGMTILLQGSSAGVKFSPLKFLRAQQNCHPDRSEA
jgi:hypothetical protein